MAKVHVGVTIHASPATVWAAVRDVDRHTEWMADAETIRLVGGRGNAVGATYEVDTKVGPFRLLDVMEITEWRARRVMGVRHVGLVTGTGRFSLRRAGRLRGGTRFTWEEELTFPVWMGGPIAGLVGAPVLRRVWKGNLRRLKALIEGSGSG